MSPRPLSAWKKAFVLLLVSTGLASSARATPSVDLFFTALNGSSIDATRSLAVLPGDRVGVEMLVTGDERGVGFYNLSVDFDSAGTGRLLLEDFGDILAPGYNEPFTDPQGPDGPVGAPGMVRLFNATTWVRGVGYQPNPFTVDATFAVAWLEFTVTDEILNGEATVAPGLFHTGVDEILSNELELIGSDYQFVPISADFAFNFATLSAAPVPEPGTGLLLAGGMLVLARMRRAR
jgi:hypothetical protein